jgi:predicted nucleic acid-binding Zn ribbon protein
LKNIKNNISSVIFKIGGKKYHDLIVIALSWKDIVGPIMAEHSFVVKYVNYTLYIGVTESVWLQEFVLNKHFLLTKMNSAVKSQLSAEIKNIIFVLREKKND